MMERIIPRLLGQVPVSWRRAIIGRGGNPSRFATFAHNWLNRMATDESQVFACRGALEGYRMSIDWSRFRSFVYGTWEPEVVEVVLANVTEGMAVIDVGAHIGYYSLLLAKCAGPAGRVVAFEPLPENFAALQRNVQLNGLGHVTTFRQAVFSRCGEIFITVPENSSNSGDASVILDHGRKQFPVAAISLDSFCASTELQFGFIKIDVEGAERDVLLGARHTIARCKPKILIELHHFDGNLAGHPVPGLLKDWGYDIQWIERSQLTSHILALPRYAA